MKVFLALSLFLLSFVVYGAAGESPPKGYIQNQDGEKCWFNNVIDSQSKYFYGSITSTTATITFQDALCMTDTGIGHTVNKMMINNYVSKWYSLPDASFQTRESELFSGSSMQKKGQCIQSQTYPAQGIAIDYIMSGKGIAQVMHTTTINGCK